MSYLQGQDRISSIILYHTPYHVSRAELIRQAHASNARMVLFCRNGKSVLYWVPLYNCSRHSGQIRARMQWCHLFKQMNQASDPPVTDEWLDTIKAADYS